MLIELIGMLFLAGVTGCLGWYSGRRSLRCKAISAAKKSVVSSAQEDSYLDSERRDEALAMEAGGISAWRYDLKNRCFTAMIGRLVGGEDRITMNQFLQQIHPDDREGIASLLRRLSEGRETTGLLYVRHHRPQQKTFRYYECRMGVRTNTRTGEVYIAGTHRDVTDEVFRRRTLEESNRKTLLAIRVSDLTQWDYDCATHCYRLLISGTQNDGLPFSHDVFLETVHPEDRKIAQKMITHLEGCRSEEIHIDLRLHINGESGWRYVTMNGAPVKDVKGRVSGYTGFRRDNTQWVELNERLKESHLKTQLAVRASGILPWEYDVQKGVFTTRYYNDQDRERTLLLSDYMEATHPDDVALAQPAWDILKQGRNESFTLELRYKYKSQPELGWQYGTVRGVPFEVDPTSGEVLKFIGFSHNTTRLQRLNEQLRESHLKSELAIRQSGLMTWEYDCEQGVFETHNEDEALMNREMTLESYLELTHPDDQQKTSQAWEIMRRGANKSFTIDIRFRLPGHSGWRSGTVAGIPFQSNKQGQVIRYLGFRQDNTKFVRLNNELLASARKVDLALRTSDLVQWDYDVPTRSLSYYNEPIKGRGHGVMPIEEFNRHFHPEDRAAWREYEELMNRGEDRAFNFDVRMRYPGYDADQYCTVDGIPFEKDERGRVVKYTGFRRNNTRWYQLARDLQRAKEQAERSDRLKSAFVANMSHEIRTPLNAIVGFSELMLNTDSEAVKRQYWQIIKNNNDLLLNLIGDILDISRIESGMLEFKQERFDLSELFGDIYRSLLQRPRKKGVRFTCENPYRSCLVTLDRNRFTQVVTNFVTNAIKFTPSGSIRMGYTASERGIRLWVSDTGIGIAPEKQPRVFLRFEKLDDFAQGTGLGMAICKAIVESQGGEIGVESQVNRGATFWATFPADPQIVPLESGVSGVFDNSTEPEDGKRQEESAPVNDTLEEASCEESDGANPRKNRASRLPESDLGERSVAQPAGGDSCGAERDSSALPCVLIAEDNDSNYLLICTLVSGRCAVERAENGAEAVEQVRNRSYDLVLMDMKMPVMDGLDATRQIRTFNGQVPIVALTANAFDSDREQAIQAGCTDFLTKPVNLADLNRLIDRLERDRRLPEMNR